MITFIVLACQMNVSIPNEESQSCKIFKEELISETHEITPMQCMAESMPMIVKFHEKHPGWVARKWSCKYLTPTQDL